MLVLTRCDIYCYNNKEVTTSPVQGDRNMGAHGNISDAAWETICHIQNIIKRYQNNPPLYVAKSFDSHIFSNNQIAILMWYNVDKNRFESCFLGRIYPPDEVFLSAMRWLTRRKIITLLNISNEEIEVQKALGLFPPYSVVTHVVNASKIK